MKIISSLLLFVCFMFVQKTNAQEFVHPGIYHTIEDLEYMKAHKDIEPWKSSYEIILGSTYSALDYQMAGPFNIVNREPNENFSQYEADSKAALYQSILFYVTGNEVYGQNATNILNAWATTHTEWGGGTVHIQDFTILDAAEIIRYTYSGWTEEHSTNFENYARNVLLDVTHYPYTAKAANQGVLQLNLIMRIAIFLSDKEMFNVAIDAFLNDPCSGLGNSLPSGANGDSGRDQAHAWMVVNFLSQAAEAAYHQGVDLFSSLDDRLYQMGEYWFKYNLGYDVDWVPFGTCYGYYPTIGESARGNLNTHPRLYETLYNAYVLRKGYEAPYLKEFRASQQITEFTFLTRKESDESIVPEYSGYLTEPTASHTELNASSFTGVNLGSDKTGYSTYTDGVLTLNASSGDGYGGSNSDGGYFDYVNIQGDATIIAKIDSHTNSDTSIAHSKAGVMFRESLSASSDMFAVYSSSDQLISTWRGYEGPRYTGDIQYFPEAHVPAWLKIVVNGERISGFVSEDKINWAPIGGKHYNGTDNYYLGLYGGSINTSNTTIATFSDIEIFNGVECADYSYNSFNKIEAESFCKSEEVNVYTADGNTYVGDVQTNDWIKYPNFNFTTQEPVSVDVNFASTESTGQFYLKLDDPTNGEIIATINLENTGGLTAFSTTNVSLTNTTQLTGSQDVYLVFDNEVHVDWFKFKNSCHLELSKNAFETIEAEDYCNMLGVSKNTSAEIEYIEDAQQGDWLYYPNVDFSTTRPNSIFINCASTNGGIINIMTNDPVNGTLISKIEVEATGAETNFETFSSAVTSAMSLEGLKDVYITFEGSCNIDHFYFDNNECYTNIFYKESIIEAEDFCEMSGVEKELIDIDNYTVSNIQNGDYIRFPRIQLDTKGANVFEVTAATATVGGTIEIRSEAVDGVLMGTLNITSTGDDDIYETFSLNLGDFMTSYQDLYFVFTSSENNGDLFKIDNFSFKYQQCSDMYSDAFSEIQAEGFCEVDGINVNNSGYIDNIQSGEWASYANVDFSDTPPAFVEIRVASASSSTRKVHLRLGNAFVGQTIATFESGSTGGWSNFKSIIKEIPAEIAPQLTGKQDLYLYYESGLNTDYFKFSQINDVVLSSFDPDTTKTYYLDVPKHNLRLSADGISENPFTVSSSTETVNEEWRFIENNDGYWYIERAQGGAVPRLTSSNNGSSVMGTSSSEDIYSYFYVDDRDTSNSTFYITHPDVFSGYERIQVNNSGDISMVPSTYAGSWEQFRITEVTSSKLSIEDVYLNKLIATPNPVKSTFVINTVNSSEVNIFDVNGKMVFTEKSVNNETQINVSHLSPGIYYVEVIALSKKSVFKIIKN